MDKWRDLARREGLFLLAPQSISPRDWSRQKTDADTVMALVDTARREAGLQSGPVLLFGHSAGAKLAMRLAHAAPSQFAAVVAHAGYPGQTAMERRPGPAKGGRAPVTLLLGDADHIFDVELARQSGEALSKARHDVTLKTLRGHTHWYYSAAPRINRMAWASFRKAL